ncbi:MAG: hypothetical protein KJO07_07715, partial [Deltaproteobacteria bacterium]|nr:hypothetical protein [Deltaproteobacteria bacterium]
MPGRAKRAGGMALMAIAIACGGSPASDRGPHSAPGPKPDTQPELAEPAAEQPARAGEQEPSTAVPKLALEGKCGRTVKAHLRSRRGEHNLELVAALLYQSCADGKWDPLRHACVARADGMEAVVSCRAEA